MLPEKDRALLYQQISTLDSSLSQLEAVESKLAKELDDIRSRISSLRNQRAALENRIAAVWSLPNELLSYIFELGVMEQQAAMEEEDENNDETEKASTHEDEVSYKNIPFQVLTSQVCRMFRHISLRTPSLWTQIHIPDLGPRQFDFARMCVERSGASRLDILLETENSYIVEKGALSSFMAILAPHISRFQRFVVRLPGFPSLHFIMQALDQPAPLLETLELSDNDYEAVFDEEEPFDPPELRKPLTLFGGIVPKLSRLSLDGAHVDWNACNFKNLVELQLAYHTRDVRPSYDEFKAIIQTSPALRSLHLGASAPLIAEDSTESALYTPLLLEQLTDLSISEISSDYVTTLISLLRAPNLKYLALTNMNANDYTSLVRHVAGPPVMFPALTSLKVATIEADDGACEDMLHAYPTLTYLSLYLENISFIWLEVLDPRGGEHEVICPKLECLRCVGGRASDIKRVLERRRDAGFPILRLELDEDCVEIGPTSCMKWIQENTEMEVIVPSEYGSDEDTMDGTPSDWVTDDDGEGISFPYVSVGDFSEFDEEEDEEDEEGGDSDMETDGSNDTDTDGSDESAL